MIEAKKNSTNDSPLLELIKKRINRYGPLTIAEYMGLCLGHPKHGYYMTRDPFGAQGDFTTAPEISQLFGEVLGVWLVDQWMKQGSPKEFHLVELGPGRGTLISDILRAAKVVPEFLQGCHVHLVEMSPVLKKMQKHTLSNAACPVTWHQSIDSLPDGPKLFVANEFFDALPIHQYMFENGQWHERAITFENKGLSFTTTPTNHDFGPADEGAIKETSPLSEKILAKLIKNTSKHPLSGVLIDYGCTEDTFGDTFQALKKHTFREALSAPGEQDLTAHVNFAKLKNIALELGVEKTYLTTQQDFLQMNGIGLRLQSLCRGKDTETCAKIKADANRLVDPTQMGELFKVLTLSHAGLADIRY